ncbi:MAG TPA: hypothetical protein VHZ52_07465 [Acidobacteriaceae bacterium]|jgi:hypothetical protein|nr:hypothetical protein [Acidobacteriaceae bacterium]
MRVRFNYPIAPPLSTVIFLSVWIIFAPLRTWSQSPAQDQVSNASRPGVDTLAVFPDPKASPLSDDLWQALVASLRQQMASGSPEIQALESSNPPANHERHVGGPMMFSAEAAPETPSLQILRGEQITPGIKVNNPITVYLRGECKTTLESESIQPGTSATLGWVNRNNGQIAPFIYVDCKRIGQMLRPAERARKPEQRTQLMADAMARVILHEWIHIATQSPEHAKNGIAKAQFGVQDLETNWPNPSGSRWQTIDHDSIQGFAASPPPNQTSSSRVWATR